MAFWLNRFGKQLVRLSSSSLWAPKPQQIQACLITRVNNNNNNNTSNCYFSTDSSSPGGMNQQSNPKDDNVLKHLSSFGEYLTKNPVNSIQNERLPSDADFYKFLDDLVEKLPSVDSEKKDADDRFVENPEAAIAEILEAISDFCDIISGGLTKNLKPPAFKVKGDKFNFAMDTNGLYLTVNVSGLAKEQLVTWVVGDRVLIASKFGVPPDQMVREGIRMPDDHNYDPHKVTRTIMEDGQLKISFPFSKVTGAKELKDRYFRVNWV